jgi:RNase P protein component
VIGRSQQVLIFWGGGSSCVLVQTLTSEKRGKKTIMRDKFKHHVKSIMLLKDHRLDAKISIDYVVIVKNIQNLKNILNNATIVSTYFIVAVS